MGFHHSFFSQQFFAKREFKFTLVEMKRIRRLTFNFHCSHVGHRKGDGRLVDRITKSIFDPMVSAAT